MQIKQVQKKIKEQSVQSPLSVGYYPKIEVTKHKSNLCSRYNNYLKKSQNEQNPEQRALLSNNCVALKLIMNKMDNVQKPRSRSDLVSGRFLDADEEIKYKMNEIKSFKIADKDQFTLCIQEEMNLILYKIEYSQENELIILEQKVQSLKIIARKSISIQQRKIDLVEIFQKQYQKAIKLSNFMKREINLEVAKIPCQIMSDQVFMEFLIFNMIYLQMQHFGKLTIKCEKNRNQFSMKFELQVLQQTNELKKALSLKYLLNESKILRYINRYNPILIGLSVVTFLLSGSIKFDKSRQINLEVISDTVND